MKSKQDYLDRYDGILQNLGYVGESAEVLKHLLAEASYISEVENATYMQEASLEKAAQLNSKIQHCMDNMYSVFRGTCPRVIMKIRPTKYITLNPYDELIVSSSFRIYYLGYYTAYRSSSSTSSTIDTSSSNSSSDSTENGSESVISSSTTEELGTNKVMDTTDVVGDEGSSEGGSDEESKDSVINENLDEIVGVKDGWVGKWEYSGATFYPAVNEEDDVSFIILGFLAPKRPASNLDGFEEWTIDSWNGYYVDCIKENLSDDMYVEIVESTGEITRLPRTRIFSEHILDHKIFDLTLPSFGSRLYLANYYNDTVGRSSEDIVKMSENTTIRAKYFEYSELSEYQENELKRIQYKGAEWVAFNETWLNSPKKFGSNSVYGLKELVPGICYVDAIPRDGLGTIHYKASRDRYVNSILRSNSDIGVVLEEAYPDVVKSGGTSYLFSTGDSTLGEKDSTIDIYYIPKEEGVLLTESQIETFKNTKRAYYVVTTVINIQEGKKYTATFNITLDLFKNSSEDWEILVGQEILKDGYEKKFNITFDDTCKKEIESLISKISNVKRISTFDITFSNSSGEEVEVSEIDPTSCYFEIKYAITTSVTQAG